MHKKASRIQNFIAYVNITASAGADATKMVFTATAQKGGIAMIRITDVIATDTAASAESISAQVRKLIMAGATTAEVYINSRGGDTFEATEIVNALKQFPTPPTITVGALAASAATYLCSEFYTKSKSNSRFMIHKPSAVVRGNEDAVEKVQTMLKDITSEYRKGYAKKMRKTEEEIEALWARGDVWMTAQEAKECGLVDEIEGAAEAITREVVAKFTALGCPASHLPVITSNSNTTMTREELIATLGLPADATDEQIKEALQKMKEKADAADAASQNAEADAAKKATALAQKGCADKKYAADLVPHFESLAKKDYEGTKKLIDSMTAVAAASTQIPGTGKGDPDKHKGWTLDDYLDKDPEALQALAESDPAKFDALNEAHYKSKPTTKQ